MATLSGSQQLPESELNSRALKKAVPRLPLKFQHTRHCTLVPNREHILDALPKGAAAAEVGVAFGDFTQEIIRRCQPRVLHLIDSWGTARYAEGLAKIRAELAAPLERGEIVIHQGLSTEILPTLQDDSLDFVYIDTDHSYETTSKELALASQKARRGGRIAGHDYCVGNIHKPWPYGVIEAVGEFCNKFEWGLEYFSLEIHGHSTFCLRRLAELGSDQVGQPPLLRRAAAFLQRSRYTNIPNNTDSR